LHLVYLTYDNLDYTKRGIDCVYTSNGTLSGLKFNEF